MLIRQESADLGMRFGVTTREKFGNDINKTEDASVQCLALDY